jgi:pyrophosphate--fructose-6-phosphate 1-phosphotransferase
MGRSASHIALECALQTQPNVTIISEEVEQKKMTLQEVVDMIADVVVKRAADGNNFGSVLIPEGLVEFIPEMKSLIAELNDMLAKHEDEVKLFESNRERREFVAQNLSASASSVFVSLPSSIANQLMLDRDPHGNVQVSLIETEKLLIDMVKAQVKALKKQEEFKGKFNGQAHFFGYEGRCASPSNFDADYCYALGITAAVLVAEGKTGYMASVRNLIAPSQEWIAGGVPVTMMMNMERRHGEMKPVIQKALVDLKGKPFADLVEHREEWAFSTSYIYPGPIQYFGPPSVCDQTTITLQLEQK